MSYCEIKGIPDQDIVNELRSSELKALGELWIKKKSELENSNEYKEFIVRMQREWAIETGIIERLYTWDRGVTEVLIEQGIDASLISHKSGLGRDKTEHISKIINDQEGIVEGLFEFIKEEKELNEHFIRSLHQEFTQHQDSTDAIDREGRTIQISLLKGEYKKFSNNPRRSDGTEHIYCPPERVRDQMEWLLKEYHLRESAVSPEVLSAWLHHRFTQIHPFQDGNGRIARALASIVFLKAGLFPLVIRDSDRKEYITALEDADAGNLEPLVKLFTKCQKNSILSALGIQQQVKQEEFSQEIISHAVQLLKKKFTKQIEERNNVYTMADQLHEMLVEELTSKQEDINSQLKGLSEISDETFNATIKSAKTADKESHYFHRQIVEVANYHNYYANTNSYKSWVRIVIYTGKIFEIVFSIHGYGYGENGVMVVSGLTFEKTPSEDKEDKGEVSNVLPSNHELFQFNYLEDIKDIKKRFEGWLHDSIMFALTEWKKTLS